MISLRETCLFMGPLLWSIAVNQSLNKISPFPKWTLWTFSAIGVYCILYLYIVKEKSKDEQR